ncbi:hypothetical protein J3459_011013 [Metarhizium acridum]|nr:hypothetical protein J3459_011013 [Metarhizium acridum]
MPPLRPRSPPRRPQGPLCTRQSLVADLRNLGINKGDTLLVHSSLKSMGFVSGGAETVVSALLQVLGREGTLVVPAFSCGNSDPSTWKVPPVSLDVDEAWWPALRASIPAYDPEKTRTLAVGTIPETVRTWPSALRSAHPQVSFAAIGLHAGTVTANHALDCCFGEQSPLARMEGLSARVLLLGVGYHRCTCFHLAEGRVSSPKMENSFAVTVDGTRRWLTVEDTVINGDDFEELGADFERDCDVRRGFVGAADCAALSLPEATLYAKKWFQEHR